MKLWRITLMFSSKFQGRSLLNITRSCSQNCQMSYLFSLPIKNICSVDNSHYLGPAILRSIVQLLSIRHCSVVPNNEIQSLCDFIVSENSENYESEAVEELKKIISFLLTKGYKSKDIKTKFLPYLKSSNCSYMKFNLLADIGPDIILLLPLLSLPLAVLKSAAMKASSDKSYCKNFSHRIAYLCHHLELNSNELIPALIKHSTLLTMNFKRLDYKLNILKNAKINSEYIVKDLWIFNYNEKLLADRIQRALKAGVELKPWMLRCSENFFESMLRKNAETHRILDGENVQSYLAKKLQCSTDYVEYMMEINKAMKTVNIPKLEQMINFLFEKGYTPQEIRLFPRVFCSKIETLNKRFEEFQKIKNTIPSVPQLCISKIKFKGLSKSKK